MTPIVPTASLANFVSGRQEVQYIYFAKPEVKIKPVINSNNLVLKRNKTWSSAIVFALSFNGFLFNFLPLFFFQLESTFVVYGNSTFSSSLRERLVEKVRASNTDLKLEHLSTSRPRADETTTHHHRTGFSALFV